MKVELSDWLFEAARPGIQGRAGFAIALKCEKALAAYFRQLGASINLDHLSSSDYAHIIPHVNSVIAQGQPVLRSILELYVKQAYLFAGKLSVLDYIDQKEYPPSSDVLNKLAQVEEGRTSAAFMRAKNKVPTQAQIDQEKIEALYKRLDKLGPTGQAAADYAREYVAELVTGLDDTSKKRIGEIVAQDIEKLIPTNQIVRDIRAEFTEMAGYRARSIAVTELNDAMSEATFSKIKNIGLPNKRWFARPGACRICQGNVAAGVIPVADEFPSGVLRPPGHPGKCRCVLLGAR